MHCRCPYDSSQLARNAMPSDEGGRETKGGQSKLGRLLRRDTEGNVRDSLGDSRQHKVQRADQSG